MSVVYLRSLGTGARNLSEPVPPLPSIDGFETVEDAVAALTPSEPVYCLYAELLRRAAARFVAGFPGKPLYAVKANPAPHVLHALWSAGVTCFDTASLAEVRLVRKYLPGAHCYFMGPAKLLGAAEAAYRDFGVRHFVADHASEVERLLAATGPDARIHIRMKAFAEQAVFELSSKFGATADEASAMLARVASAGRRPGLAFNVGSQCAEPAAYRRAIAAAAAVAREAGGIRLASLDVGGGFPMPYPGQSIPALGDFFAAVRKGARDAGLPGDCELYCEPGRALVAEGQSILAQVILVKDRQVFLNDGVYGSFREWELARETVTFPLRVIRPEGAPSVQTETFTAYGPTCDSLDRLPAPLALPLDIRVGDWIEFGLAGAYTNASASPFNGFTADRWVRIEGAGALPPGVSAD